MNAAAVIALGQCSGVNAVLIRELKVSDGFENVRIMKDTD